MTWRMTEKSINSRVLKDEVHEIIAAAIDEIGINWSVESQRTAFTELVGEFFGDLKESGRIEQWDVVCDARNNNSKDMMNGTFIFDVNYKQKNCLNTSRLRYVISPSDLLDFDPQF